MAEALLLNLRIASWPNGDSWQNLSNNNQISRNSWQVRNKPRLQGIRIKLE